MNVVFVLGSHVRHVGVGAREGYLVSWSPLCRQRRPRNDLNGLTWPMASTPAQHARPVCSHCVREARKIAGAVL